MCCKTLAYARTTHKLPTGSLHKNSKPILSLRMSVGLKLACRGHIPLTPFALQNSEITSAEFLNFYA